MSTGAFHEGLREAMASPSSDPMSEHFIAHMMERMRAGVTVAMLRDQFRSRTSLADINEAERRVEIQDEQSAAEQRVVAEHEGRIYELVIFTADESQMAILKSVASDLESHGDEPFVRWTRDPDGEIVGMSLWARLSTETLAGMGEVPFASLRATAVRKTGLRYEPVTP